MRIYTKTGDAGESSLFRGGRVPKDHLRLESYGTLDELNAALGLALAGLDGLPEATALSVGEQLRKIQRDLFCLGAELATVGGDKPAWHLVAEDVLALEGHIDRMDAELPPLTTFVLPGGHPVGAALHLARTITRRAERLMVALQREVSASLEAGDLGAVATSAREQEALGLRYVNRLSDHLFVLARWTNHQAQRPEPALAI